MQNESKSPSLMYLAVRLFAGIYLMYTAWDLRGAISESPFFIVAIVAFAVIGAVLTVQSGIKIVKGNYEGGQSFFFKKQEEPAEEEE